MSRTMMKLYTNTLPVGRGFVNINNDTALPDQPGLDQSLPQQRAMISVFHQLHCIVSILLYNNNVMKERLMLISLST